MSSNEIVIYGFMHQLPEKKHTITLKEPLPDSITLDQALVLLQSARKTYSIIRGKIFILKTSAQEFYFLRNGKDFTIKEL